jgi:DNA-binding IclR family transcriptional regulator
MSTQEGWLQVTEISEAVRLNKSTTFRILNALIQLDFVRKSKKKYRLSLKFVHLSSMLLGQVELKTETYPFLKKLANMTKQSVHLAMLNNNEVIYLEKVEEYHSMRMYSQIGRSVPIHSTALGKVLTAWMPEQQYESVLASLKYEKRTDNTITRREDFEKELELVRSKGYAIDNIENEDGVRCVAAPIYNYSNYVIAAISVSGDANLMVGDFLEDIKNEVVSAAKQISKIMGFYKNEEKEGLWH